MTRRAARLGETQGNDPQRVDHHCLAPDVGQRRPNDLPAQVLSLPQPVYNGGHHYAATTLLRELAEAAA
ncbi:MAG: hypothetical protein MSC31_02365 [Solirubrobacteraceae bacterium MAG38_C4-C5]|nr:hypothetical protein [Candidatus Siliceabacter maunaloa]